MPDSPPTSQTLVAFDYGLRHIGVAVGQPLIGSSSAAGVVRARDGVPDWPAIEKILKEWQPGLLLVGLPLNMDGSESPMSGRAQKFARQLQARFNIAVDLVDERLTSFAAKQNRHEQRRGDAKTSTDFGRDTVDAEAACIILLDYYNR